MGVLLIYNVQRYDTATVAVTSHLTVWAVSNMAKTEQEEETILEVFTSKSHLQSGCDHLFEALAGCDQALLLRSHRRKKHLIFVLS